jgi:hypothetical protein
VPAPSKTLLEVNVDAPVPPLATGRVPVTPVVNGRPVQLVNVPDEGVPNTGVTSVGEVASTFAPDPVDEVTPVPPLATGSVPVTFVVRFVNVVEDVPVPPLAIGSTPLTPVASAMVPLN